MNTASLQEEDLERAGSTETTKVDARVIVTTNRDRNELVKDGSFRLDLYYRLNVFPLEAPPLRDRQGDIPLLVNFFLSKFSKKLGKKVRGVSQMAMENFSKYAWPGNVRELQNVIERAVVLASGSIVNIGESVLQTSPAVQESLVSTLEYVERTHIIRVLNNSK